MEAAIDRIMQTYGLMMNITLAEEQQARARVTSHLAGKDDDEQALTVEGLRFLRALKLKSHDVEVGGQQAADGQDDHSDENLPTRS